MVLARHPSFKAILSGRQNRFDALKAWPRRVGQRFGTRCFKSANTMFVGKFQKGHTASVTLLLDFMATKDGLYSGAGIWANLLCPRDEPLSIPLDELFVILRHMRFHCAVLPGFSVKPGMRADSMILVEHLNGSSRHSNIDAMFNVLVRNGVVHFLNAYMIIELDRGGLLNRHLIGGSRQDQQKWLFFRLKHAEPAPFFFLKRLGI